MAVDIQFFNQATQELQPYGARLIAVSKTKPAEDIQKLYNVGQRDFGENYVQELLQKQSVLPEDIRWHFIGHLQSNKVKYIAPFVGMIQSVDNLKLLKEINKQAARQSRRIDCLLQVHLGDEDTKFGLNEKELFDLLEDAFSSPESISHVNMSGLMGMATNTTDEKIIRQEFHQLKLLFEKAKERYPLQLTGFAEISMGMSSDYKIALEEGSTMIRIGSKLFGTR